MQKRYYKPHNGLHPKAGPHSIYIAMEIDNEAGIIDPAISPSYDSTQPAVTGIPLTIPYGPILYARSLDFSIAQEASQVGMRGVQTVFIDNACGGGRGYLINTSTSQRIAFSSYSQGMYTFLDDGSFAFKWVYEEKYIGGAGIELSGPVPTLIFYDVPLPVGVWKSDDFTSQLTAVDYSGTIVAANVAQIVAPWDGTKRRIRIQNSNSAPGILYVNEGISSGLTIANGFELKPGEISDISYPYTHYAYCRVMSAFVGHAFKARVWTPHL
jgi:hypothetical protein